MNAGQYLVSKSPLSSGTALAHLLAMQTGGVRTVFASMFSVQIEEPRLFAVQRPKREAGDDYRPAVSRLSADTEKAVSIFTREASLSVLTEPDELFVRQGATESVVVRDLGQERFTVRQSDVVGIDETELSIHSTQPGTIVIG